MKWQQELASFDTLGKLLVGGGLGAGLLNFTGNSLSLFSANSGSSSSVTLLALSACVAGLMLCLMGKNIPRLSAGQPNKSDWISIRQSRACEKVYYLQKLFQDRPQLLFGKRLAARHIMTEGVESVRANEKVGKIAGMMRSGRMRHVVICDDEGKPIGVVSDRDLRGNSAEMKVSEVLTPDPICAHIDTTLADIIRKMLDNGVSCLPILRGEWLTGIVTSADVMIALCGMLDAAEELLAENKSATSDQSCPEPARYP